MEKRNCKTILFVVSAAVMIILMYSCSTVHQVRPLKSMEHKVSLGGGGYVVGMPIPGGGSFPFLPMATLSYQFGLTDFVTMGGTIGLALLVPFVEVHSTIGILDIGAFALSASANVQFSTWNVVLMPEIILIPSWKASNSMLLYAGVGTALYGFQKLVPEILIGSEFTLGQWDICVELRVVEGLNTTSFQPVLAPFISFSYRFGGV